MPSSLWTRVSSILKARPEQELLDETSEHKPVDSKADLTLLGRDDFTPAGREDHPRAHRSFPISRKTLLSLITALTLLIIAAVILIGNLMRTQNEYRAAIDGLCAQVDAFWADLENGSGIAGNDLAAEAAYYRHYLQSAPNFEALLLDLNADERYQIVQQKSDPQSIGLQEHLLRLQDLTLQLQSLEQRYQNAKDTLAYAHALMSDASVPILTAKSSGEQSLSSMRTLSQELADGTLPDPLLQRLGTLKADMDAQSDRLEVFLAYIADLDPVLLAIEQLSQAAQIEQLTALSLQSGVDYYQGLIAKRETLAPMLEAVNIKSEYAALPQLRTMDSLLQGVSMQVLDDAAPLLPQAQAVIDGSDALEGAIDTQLDNTKYAEVKEAVGELTQLNTALAADLEELGLPKPFERIIDSWTTGLTQRGEFLAVFAKHIQAKLDYAAAYAKANEQLDQAQYNLDMARQWLQSNRTLSNYYNSEAQKASNRADEYLRQCAEFETQAAGYLTEMQTLRSEYRAALGYDAQL